MNFKLIIHETMKIKFYLFLLLLGGICQSGFSQAKNLVANGNFEAGKLTATTVYPLTVTTLATSTPTAVLPNWSVIEAKDRQTVDFVTGAEAFGGTGSCVKIITSNVESNTSVFNPFDFKMVSDKMASEIGYSYELKYKIKVGTRDIVTKVPTNANILRTVINANVLPTNLQIFPGSRPLADLPVDNEWKEFAVTWIAPSSSDVISLETGSTLSTVFLDDISVTINPKIIVRNPTFRIGGANKLDYWTINAGSNSSTVTVAANGINELTGAVITNGGALKAQIKAADVTTKSNVSAKTFAVSTPINSTTTISFWVKTEDSGSTANATLTGSIDVKAVIPAAPTAKVFETTNAVSFTTNNTWTQQTYTYVNKTASTTTEFQFDLAGAATAGSLPGGTDIVYLIDGITTTQTLLTTAAPTGAATQIFCAGKTVADLVATGTAVKWYTTSTGGSALATSAALVTATKYYASQSVGGIESGNRLEVTATVNPNPTVTAAVAGSACAGATLNLTGGGATTYAWTGPNTFTAAVANPSIAAVPKAAAGTYIVTGTTNGCSGTASVNVVVIENNVSGTVVTATGAVTNIGNLAYVSAVRGTTIEKTVPVTASGSFDLGNLCQPGALKIVLHTTAAGSQAAALPTGYDGFSKEGTYNGSIVADATANGIIDLNLTGNTALSFEIKAKPLANEPLNSIELNVSPNPTSNQLIITSANKNLEGKSLQIFNGMGKVLLTQKYSTRNNTIDISKLPNNQTYFVRIGNERAIRFMKIDK